MLACHRLDLLTMFIALLLIFDRQLVKKQLALLSQLSTTRKRVYHELHEHNTEQHLVNVSAKLLSQNILLS